MNDIIKRLNGLITSKTSCLSLDIITKICQSFYLKAFIIATYLLSYSLSSFLKFVDLFTIWFKAYHFTNNSYIFNLDYLRTFSSRVYITILDKKQVKSKKTAFVDI